MRIDPAFLLGRSIAPLVQIPGTECLLHRHFLPTFLQIRSLARKDGIDLVIASGHRTYGRQLRIWNDKAKGKRPLVDDKGELLSIEKLSNIELLQQIMRWSAIPGFSRHHWGSEIDIYDQNALPDPCYKLQLTLHESKTVFHKLHQWLDDLINGNRFPIFRPFVAKNGIIAEEPWHLSFYPLALECMEKYTLDLFYHNLSSEELSLQKEIFEKAEEIYRYQQVLTPYTQCRWG